MLRPRAAALLFGLGLAACAAPPLSPAQAKKARLFELGPVERPLLENALNALVLLDGPQGKASAVAISPDGKALTAWHVVQDSLYSSGRTTRSLFGGRYRDSTFSAPALLAACPDQDLALLDLGIPTPAHLLPSPLGFARGERVFLVGASTGKAELSECSRMSATSDARGVHFLMDGPAFPGDSGGAVVSQRGELLGVLVKAGSASSDPRFRDWDWISAMVPTPAHVLDEILRLRPLRKRTRLFIDPPPPEGRIDPERFWKSLRFAVD